jgi:hypothetical protein
MSAVEAQWRKGTCYYAAAEAEVLMQIDYN